MCSSLCYTSMLNWSYSCFVLYFLVSNEKSSFCAPLTSAWVGYTLEEWSSGLPQGSGGLPQGWGGHPLNSVLKPSLRLFLLLWL